MLRLLPIGTAIALSTISVASVSQPRTSSANAIACSLDRPTSCPSTNDVLRDRRLAALLATFLDGRRDRLFYIGRPTSTQILDGLGGPPEARVDKPGSYLFAACRYQSCDEKAAVVIGNHGELLAVGAVYFERQRVSDGPSRIIYQKLGACTAAARSLLAWSDRAIAGDHPNARFFKSRVISLRRNAPVSC